MMSDGAIRRLIVQLPKNLLFTSVERYLLSKEGGGGEKEDNTEKEEKKEEKKEKIRVHGETSIESSKTSMLLF